MSFKLEKPNKNQRVDFIVEYNHKRRLRIEETAQAIYALEPWEELDGDTVIDNSEKYEAELVEKERERVSMLSLTAADVERAIYKAKGFDFEDILAFVKDNQEIDSKALKIELKANYFYRGNPYVEIIGALIGYSSDDLDYLFEYKELPAQNQEVNNDGMGV